MWAPARLQVAFVSDAAVMTSKQSRQSFLTFPVTHLPVGGRVSSFIFNHPMLASLFGFGLQGLRPRELGGSVWVRVLRVQAQAR